MSRQYIVWSAVLVTTDIVLLPVVSWACAVCQGANDALAQSLNVSMLFLMSMPFLICSSIIGVLYIAHKRAQGQRWLDSVSKYFVWLQKENQP